MHALSLSLSLLQLSEASLLADVDQTEYSEADDYASNPVEDQEEIVSQHSLTLTAKTLTATILNTVASWTGLEKQIYRCKEQILIPNYAKNI